MLVTLKEILKDAEQKKYAVGLFNMLNLETARGIIEAAEETRSPLILGVAEVHLPFIPFDYASLVMNKIAKQASVPVCLHFDHGTRYNDLLCAMKSGFSSVMYDASTLPLEENMTNTKEICKIAHALGISVEAELGHIGGAEDGKDDGSEAAYTNPEEVESFVTKTEVDALAIAIGTAHGQYKATPKLDLNRLNEIYKLGTVPLVLHGGSGLSNSDFKNCIVNGIRKINICTELCLAADKAYKETSGFESTITAAKNAVKQTVIDKMKLFGSAGKA